VRITFVEQHVKNGEESVSVQKDKCGGGRVRITFQQQNILITRSPMNEWQLMHIAKQMAEGTNPSVD